MSRKQEEGIPPLRRSSVRWRGESKMHWFIVIWGSVGWASNVAVLSGFMRLGCAWLISGGVLGLGFLIVSELERRH